MEENKKRPGRSRARKGGIDFAVDWLMSLLTLMTILLVLVSAVFMTVHTKVDISKNIKGEIAVSVDYDKDSEIEVPGKDLLPIAKQVLDVAKKKLGK